LSGQMQSVKVNQQQKPEEFTMRQHEPTLKVHQNFLWNVLVRNRFHPVAVAGDLKQAFLQVSFERTNGTYYVSWN
jgi:hypothetical protein